MATATSELIAELGSLDWTHRKGLMAYSTHALHTYPAKLIPQIPRQLISILGKRGEAVFDPFCGSGTTLVEANLAGMHAIGCDINPLGRLISECKTTRYPISETKREIIKFIEKLDEVNERNHENFSDVLSEMNVGIDSWFCEESIEDIARHVVAIHEAEISDRSKKLIRLAVSENLRKVSYQRGREWKLWREKDEDRKYVSLTPLVKQKLLNNLIMTEDFKRQTMGMYKFPEMNGRGVKSVILNHNMVTGRPFRCHGSRKVGLIVTSPPYGDSMTTVAYGQFSWLSNIILGLVDDERQTALDKEMMGGVISSELTPTGHEVIDSQIQRIAESIQVGKSGQSGEMRAREVHSFFVDYKKSIENSVRLLSTGGYACFIVANRTVRDRKLRMDSFTRWALSNIGFSDILETKRDILNKKMPRQNVYSSQSDRKNELMNEEIIIIMRKD